MVAKWKKIIPWGIQRSFPNSLVNKTNTVVKMVKKPKKKNKWKTVDFLKLIVSHTGVHKKMTAKFYQMKLMLLRSC